MERCRAVSAINLRLRNDGGYIAARQPGLHRLLRARVNMRSALDNPHVRFSKNSAQQGRLFGVGWADPFGGATVDTYSAADERMT